MTDWTRSQALSLGEVAMQAGLSPQDAAKALQLGARLMSHGWDHYDYHRFLQGRYN